jgi:hypothetical protein
MISLLSSLSLQFSVLGQPDAIKQIVFGSIIVLVAAGYARITSES